MNFVMKTYWLFLIVVVIGVWALPVRFRKPWLLITSYICYAAWSIPYFGLLFAAAALNHYGAKWIILGDRSRRGKVVIAGNLIILGVFKYLAWALGSMNTLGAWLGLHFALPIPKWVLPLGISFYLFESISYVVDVMRKRETIHSFWDFQLFVAFFPKLISGPILRAKEFLPQIERSLKLSPEDIRVAVREIAIGLFLKLLLADAFARGVDRGYARPSANATSLDAWILGLAFGVQVYLDFSAYSRMAIGSAKLCGIDLVPNFDHPFISRSPPEFWNRWHMSLSRWVRDYLFFPMSQRVGEIQGSPARVKLLTRLTLVRAAFVSMLILGIWHGASWPCVAYGVYHGVLLAGYHLLTYRGTDTRASGGRKAAPKEKTPASSLLAALRAFGAWAVTFALITIGFVILRAPTITDGAVLSMHALLPFKYRGLTLGPSFVFRTVGMTFLILAVGVLATRSPVGQVKKPAGSPVETRFGVFPRPLVAAAEGLGLGLLLVLAFLEMTGRNATFVYFQF